MELGHHISNRYDKELEDIRGQVLEMGGLVEKQIADAISALLQMDGDLAVHVEKNDSKVNQMEMAIDSQCSKIIARRQPTARDLRLIITVIKAITDLERIGDEAVKIGRYTQKLVDKMAGDSMQTQLAHLSTLVLRIIHDALDTFARLDAEQALRIISSDSQINKELDNLSRLLITHMMEDPRHIKSALQINWCARALERVGDHSQNICEYVIYLVKGKDVRHTSVEFIRSKYFTDEDNKS